MAPFWVLLVTRPTGYHQMWVQAQYLRYVGGLELEEQEKGRKGQLQPGKNGRPSRKTREPQRNRQGAAHRKDRIEK